MGVVGYSRLSRGSQNPPPAREGPSERRHCREDLPQQAGPQVGRPLRLITTMHLRRGLARRGAALCPAVLVALLVGAYLSLWRDLASAAASVAESQGQHPSRPTVQLQPQHRFLLLFSGHQVGWLQRAGAWFLYVCCHHTCIRAVARAVCSPLRSHRLPLPPQGSSALADMLGQLPEVFVPGFEPLDAPGLSAAQKLAFMEARQLGGWVLAHAEPLLLL